MNSIFALHFSALTEIRIDLPPEFLSNPNLFFYETFIKIFIPK